MPHYNLEDVRKAAKVGHIEYRGRKVRQDIDNLGYELRDVVTCLMSLTSLDFYKTHQYGSGEIDDAYRTDFTPYGSTKRDSIYVKFALINNCLMIDLASFHLK